MAINSKGCYFYTLGSSAALATGLTLVARTTTPRDVITCAAAVDFTATISTNSRIKFTPSSTLNSVFAKAGYFRVAAVAATALTLSGRRVGAALDTQTIGSSNLTIYNTQTGSAEVTDFSFSPSAGVIDVTNLISTAKEKVVAPYDPGQVNLTIVSYTTYFKNRLTQKSESAYELRFSDTDPNASTSYPSHINFDAKISNVSYQGAVDDRFSMSAVFELTSALSLSTATS